MAVCKKIYDNFEEYIAVFFMAVMVTALTLQVVMRLFTGASFAWAEELSRYSFLWATYLGAAVAVKKAAHVRITAQFLKASTNVRYFFRFVADALWIIGCLFVAYQCWIGNIMDGFVYLEESPTMGIYKVWVEIIIPISFVLVPFRIIEDYIKRIHNGTLAELIRYEEDA